MLTVLGVVGHLIEMDVKRLFGVLQLTRTYHSLDTPFRPDRDREVAVTLLREEPCPDRGKAEEHCCSLCFLGTVHRFHPFLPCISADEVRVRRLVSVEMMG